jgi:hypothetical protein
MAATIPEQMAAPTRVEVVIDSTTLLTSADIAWVAPVEEGGTSITGYRIQRNNGYGTAIDATTLVEITDPTTREYTYQDELLIGVTYKIIIAAVNDVHVSNPFSLDSSDTLNYSDELEITLANVPAQVTTLNQPTVGYEQGKIKLEWEAPSTFETVGSIIT